MNQRIGVDRRRFLAGVLGTAPALQLGIVGSAGARSQSRDTGRPAGIQDGGKGSFGSLKRSRPAP